MKFCPEGKKLLPFQVKGVEKMACQRHTLLGDEMGLGKTVQVIGLINALNLRKICIVCPASVKYNWFRMLNEWLTTKRAIQILNKKIDMIEPYTEIIIVNYDILIHSNIHSQITKLRFDLVAADEAHYLKNMKTERTKAVLSTGGLVHCANRTVMMTGTPVLNRPIELYPVLKVLSPKTIAPYSDYFKYARHFCDGWQDGFSFNVSGASNCAELNQRLRFGYMIRRTTEEVQSELPPKRYQLFFVEQTKGVKPLLSQIDEFTRKDVHYQNLGLDGGSLATLRRETANQKLEVCLDHIRDCVESSGKLVIFAYHHDVIKRLEKELIDFCPVTLDGTKSQGARNEAIRRFTEDQECRVFIGQIQAAGQGIDGLQKVASNVLFVEWSWVPGEVEQAAKRVHRMGQTKPVLIQFLVWANSVEEHMMKVTLEKVEVIQEIMA